MAYIFQDFERRSVQTLQGGNRKAVVLYICTRSPIEDGKTNYYQFGRRLLCTAVGAKEHGRAHLEGARGKFGKEEISDRWNILCDLL